MCYVFWTFTYFKLHLITESNANGKASNIYAEKEHDQIKKTEDYEKESGMSDNIFLL